MNGDLSSAPRCRIEDPWPIKLLTTDRFDENLVRKRDGIHDINEYAKFVCALTWNLIDMCDVENRNEVFDIIFQCMDKEWYIPERVWYYLKMWFTKNINTFSKKQQKKLLNCLGDDIQDQKLDADYDPDKPGCCQGNNCDEPPGLKSDDYLCPGCIQDSEFIGIWDDY